MPALIHWWTQDVLAVAPTAFEDAVQAAGADLLARWSQPHRHYHDTRHLVEVFWALEELEDAREIGERSATVCRLAGWFHDAVYAADAPAGANEADSALLARAVLPGLDLDHADVDAVESLVLMTAAHSDAAEAPADAGRCFHDADLWILSAEPDRFDAYCGQVRAEYSFVPDAAYRAGRAHLLRTFAGRDRIYRTDHARSEWEPRARVNLDRELTRLGAPELDPL
jgi:predicted metal-dependent HD superfamily phosphohydrolase